MQTDRETRHDIAAGRHAIALTINGQPHGLDVAPWTTLLDLLREHLDLSGTKKGCDHGQCGACTVIIDGRRMNACLKLAVTLDGSSIRPWKVWLTQTARCTSCRRRSSSMTRSSAAIARRVSFAPASRCWMRAMRRPAMDIRELMSGNLCRCGAYPNIVDAIESVLPGAGR